jgi:hypothetical protein
VGLFLVDLNSGDCSDAPAPIWVVAGLSSLNALLSSFLHHVAAAFGIDTTLDALLSFGGCSGDLTFFVSLVFIERAKFLLVGLRPPSSSNSYFLIPPALPSLGWRRAIPWFSGQRSSFYRWLLQLHPSSAGDASQRHRPQPLQAYALRCPSAPSAPCAYGALLPTAVNRMPAMRLELDLDLDLCPSGTSL